MTSASFQDLANVTDFTVVFIILWADINPSRATIARFTIVVSRFAQLKMPVLVAVVLVIENILL